MLSERWIKICSSRQDTGRARGQQCRGFVYGSWFDVRRLGGQRFSPGPSQLLPEMRDVRYCTQEEKRVANAGRALLNLDGRGRPSPHQTQNLFDWQLPPCHSVERNWLDETGECRCDLKLVSPCSPVLGSLSRRRIRPLRSTSSSASGR